MTDHSTDPIELDATLVGTETYQPAWGGLVKPIEGLAGFLPSHRDTKKGRSTAKQIRIVIMVLGLAVLISGGTLPLIFIGAAIMASAIILPMSEVNKRALISRIRRLRSRRTRQTQAPGKLVHDGKRLILREDGKKLRRVLVDRGEHRLELRRLGDTPCLGVIPPSGRKADSIWICSPQHGSVPEESTEIAASDVDIWVHLPPNEWETIYRALNE
ncbi:MAG: hypothetical protein ACLFVJ_00755 [Persicimonas sp.]